MRFRRRAAARHSPPAGQRVVFSAALSPLFKAAKGRFAIRGGGSVGFRRKTRKSSNGVSLRAWKNLHKCPYRKAEPQPTKKPSGALPIAQLVKGCEDIEIPPVLTAVLMGGGAR